MAHRATIDYEEILRQIPPEERALTPSPSAFKSRVRPLDRSPYKIRTRKRLNFGGCNDVNTEDFQRSQSSSSPSDDSDADTLSKRSSQFRNTRQLRSNAGGKADERRGAGGGGREYCTQRCILGIVTTGYLDGACPNLTSHRKVGTGNRHIFDHLGSMRRMCRQLERSLDEGCQPLGMQGSRGALFKMTLLSHGYTFVAKGTIDAFTPEADCEARVYHRLKPLQGTYIPVYLGSVELGRPYYLDLRVYIVRMLFLSWGGTALKGESISSLDRATREEVVALEQRLVSRGILHCDIRPANVLRDPKTSSLMLIDFERSHVKPRPILHEMSGNPKDRRLGRSECEP